MQPKTGLRHTCIHSIHLPTASMLTLEAVATGLVLGWLTIVYIAWDLCQLHIAVNRTKKDLDAMRMTLASVEQV